MNPNRNPHIIPTSEVRDILNADTTDAEKLAALRDITRPTLADMTPDEVSACQWAQATVIGEEGPHIILTTGGTHHRPQLLAPTGETGHYDDDDIIPRPDLPRFQWPTATAPTTPKRLAPGVEWHDRDAITITAVESGKCVTVKDIDGDRATFTGEYWEGDAAETTTGELHFGAGPWVITRAEE